LRPRAARFLHSLSLTTTYVHTHTRTHHHFSLRVVSHDVVLKGKKARK
jgi:hypothetical protein